jgi:hypothetical protein
VLDQLVKSAPVQIAKLTPEAVPVLSEAIWDTKTDVKNMARESLTNTTALVSNKDIERFIPALINALNNPVEEVPKTIQLLGHHIRFRSRLPYPLTDGAPLLAWSQREADCHQASGCCVSPTLMIDLSTLLISSIQHH